MGGKIVEREYPFWIGGQWKRSSKLLEVRSPYDDRLAGITFQGETDHAEEAIGAAVRAFEETRRLAAYQRSEILRAASTGIRERLEDFARIIALEAGKPIKDARGEVNRSVNTFQIASEEAKRIPGEMLPLDLMPGSEGRLGIVRRFPVGPIVGIAPFNFPLNLVAHKIAPAIASGNSIILKPASKTPLTALLLAEVLSRCGLPDGAVNVLPCPGKLAEQMAVDPRIKMVTFTGSAEVGWGLKAKANKKKVILELGGNAGVIIHSDADLDYAAKRCTVGAFSFSGQVCISVQRIFVQDGIFDRFMEKFLKEVKALKGGDPLDESTSVSAMIDRGAAEKTETLVAEAVSKGAKLLAGGKRDGAFLDPTVLTDTRPEMKVNCEEAFAPIVTVARYKTLPEALRLLNDSSFGLQAGIFARDIKEIFHAYEEAEVGGLIVNDVPAYRIDHMPYGGVKDSGFGREGVKYAIEEMTEMRLLAMNLK